MEFSKGFVQIANLFSEKQLMEISRKLAKANEQKTQEQIDKEVAVTMNNNERYEADGTKKY